MPLTDKQRKMKRRQRRVRKLRKLKADYANTQDRAKKKRILEKIKLISPWELLNE